jgi:hypothetical protein
VGLPPAPPRSHAPEEGGTAPEPRPDAPNPEQLELADDPEGLVPPPGPAVPAPRTANGDGAAGPVPEGTGSTARERS